MTHKRHIEALHYLATGEKLKYVACIDCKHWAGKCTKGRTVTLPHMRIHLCGDYQQIEVTEP